MDELKQKLGRGYRIPVSYVGVELVTAEQYHAELQHEPFGTWYWKVDDVAHCWIILTVGKSWTYTRGAWYDTCRVDYFQFMTLPRHNLSSIWAAPEVEVWARHSTHMKGEGTTNSQSADATAFRRCYWYTKGGTAAHNNNETTFPQRLLWSIAWGCTYFLTFSSQVLPTITVQRTSTSVFPFTSSAWEREAYIEHQPRGSHVFDHVWI